MAGAFFRSAAGRMVVELSGEHLVAKLIPVADGVTKVQVPYFIYDGRGGCALWQGAAEVEKALVLFDSLPGKRFVPVIFLCQLPGEWKDCIGIIQLKVFDPLP